MNEHRFPNLARGRAIIEAWRREYNEERPKKTVGGLPCTAPEAGCIPGLMDRFKVALNDLRSVADARGACRNYWVKFCRTTMEKAW